MKKSVLTPPFVGLFYCDITAAKFIGRTIGKYLSLAAVALLLMGKTAPAATDLFTAAAGTAWLNNANWASNIPTGVDVAQFGVNPTSATAGVGINFANTTNAGTQTNGQRIEEVGALEILSTRTAANLIIGNSSSTAGPPASVGKFRFNGATVNSVANVILRNNSSGQLTLQDTQGSGNLTMSVLLGNVTDNIVNIDGAGGIRIQSVISDDVVAGAKHLTLGGAGAGVLVLANQNTYTGGTTVNSGKTLQVGDGAAGTLSNTGTLQINNNANVTFFRNVNGTSYQARITGQGSLTKTGTNTLTLNNGLGNSDYSGGTTISQGSIVWNSNDALGTGTVTINDANTAANNTSLIKNNSGTLTRNIVVANAGTGTTTIGNDSGTNTAATLYSGDITLNKSATLKSGAGALVWFSGNIGGNGGTTITGTGTVELTGNGSNYSGNTVVSGGTLLANNTSGSATGAGNVSVSSGALFGGTGAVSGAVTIDGGGTLSPGASIESLGTGSLTFSAPVSGSGSTLNFEIGPPGSADLVNAALGSLSIADPTSTVGVSLNLVPASPGLLHNGDKYTVIAYKDNSWNGNSFVNAPNLGYVFMGTKKFQIRYQDTTPGGNFTSETLPLVNGSARFVTLTVVPELGSFITMGLVGCCAMAAVRLGKRYGYAALKI